MNKIAEWFKGLSLHQKTKFVKLAILGVCLIMIVIVFSYMMSKKSAQIEKNQKPAGAKEIQIDKNLLDKTAYLESSKEIQKIKDANEQIKKEIDQIKKNAGQQLQNIPGMRSLPPMPAASQPTVVNKQDQQSLPSLPNQAKSSAPPPPPTASASPSMAGIPPPPSYSDQGKETLGGIETVKNTDIKAEDKDVKKKNRTIYIPASTIIPVTLLSGVDATTMEDAKRPNVPVVLRIDNLAFLPNEFKANLKGCRILAQGLGSLADERVHLRSLSLTCISKTGKALIESDIQGYLADVDGKGGVRGNVVSKMDEALWRAFLAGLFGGAGEAIKAQSTPTATITLGTSETQTINTQKIRNAAIGSGLVSASTELQKFYMELARQLSPTIEVGALRKLAFITTKGVDLEIKTPNLIK